MLFLLIKLLMIAIIALLLVPIRFSVAAYFSLDREMVLIVLRIFGINALRFNVQSKNDEWITTINGKPSKKVDKRSLRHKLIRPLIKSVDLRHIECAVQFGTDDAKTTALLSGAIKGLFLPLKAKCESANIYVFNDWENEVGNLAARLDVGIIPLKVISEI